MLETAALVERFKADTGAYPKELGELVPRYSIALPVCPKHLSPSLHLVATAQVDE